MVQATLEERVRTKAGANLGLSVNDVLESGRKDFSAEGEFAAVGAKISKRPRIETKPTCKHGLLDPVSSIVP